VIRFKELNCESAIRGDFGHAVAQQWRKWNHHHLQRQALYPIKPDEKILKILDPLKEKGYVILKDFFDKNLLEKLNAETQLYIREGKFQKSSGGGNKKGPEKEIRESCLWTTIDHPQYNFETLLDVGFHDDLINIAAQYFGCIPALGTCNLRKSYVNNLPENHTQLYHQDTNSVNFIKMFFYLNKVDKGGGPFCIVEGSHKKKFDGCYTQYRWETQKINTIYGEDKIRYLTADVGDLIIVNTTSFHRGTKPLVTDRTMLTLNWVIHPENFAPITFPLCLFSPF